MSTRTIGISLKMYFGHERTLNWCADVAEIARRHPAVRDGAAQLFVLPSFPALAPALDRFRDTPVEVGAQDLFWEDEGAFTGEVSGSVLREMGCGHVEVGHAERRRLFGEDDSTVAAKTAAALRNGLVPVLCLGEEQAGGVTDAARTCREQLDAALAAAREAHCLGAVAVAYEPQWAIGAAEPADPEFIGAVCGELRTALDAEPLLAGSRVIYGGSAKPGLLSALGDSADGLFLGRFAHDPAALEEILDEVVALDGALP
ncbi:triose-phosphate isomerase [Saccharopolyspora sp. NFXS83]|uniref:triose-phosphate isomerase family protein n=1 Tax=Saccharopolyspora sp. NFXS83 TaxID=2993560 RepID=UPI00224B275D|nr:triose-phosphate isomerase family protein [Saccharopolyspora sp. NFXS83]MCX2731966.1 triose-phosphate isomerase [Saccharopolyspora sp. NFXS83]